jgi:hypothetical protein
MVREIADTLVRNVRDDRTAARYGSQPEALRHQDAGPVFRGSDVVPSSPHTNRAFGPQCDVGCDNEDHFIKGRHITCDRVANAIAIKAWIARAAWALEIEQHYVLALEWYEDHAELNEQGEVRLSR